jgi:hypothetical protein
MRSCQFDVMGQFNSGFRAETLRVYGCAAEGGQT